MKNTKRIMETMKIKVWRMDSSAFLPSVNHEGDAGMDFYSLEDYIVKPQNCMIGRTGITVYIPEGYVGLIWPKSRNNHLIGAGVVDQTYTGEILFKIVNYYDHDLVIRRGDGIGQMILVSNISPEIEEIDNMGEVKTARGTTGGIVEQLVDGSGHYPSVFEKVTPTIEEIVHPEIFERKTWD